MSWWHKVRRVWLAINTRIKASHKTGDGGVNGLPSSPENDSLLQLREDIKKCESEDVKVMWSILTQIQMDGKAEMLPEAEVCTCYPRRRRQNSSRWRLLVLGIQQRI